MDVKSRAKINFTIDLTLNETEARALDALQTYGFKPFIKVFYEKLGETYMRDHESGLKSFFDSIREDVLPQLSTIDNMRKVWHDNFKNNLE